MTGAGALDRPAAGLGPRRLEGGEELAFVTAVSQGFHEDEPEALLARRAEALAAEPDVRSWVVSDRDRIVGNLGVYATDLSLPGASPLPVTAVTAVGVAQTHRRRGLLRGLMDACLEEAVALEEPVAALYASEAAIYGRFGFGLSAPGVAYRLARAQLRFRDRVDPTLVQPLDADEALGAVRPVFEAMRAQRAGVGRTAMQWHRAFVEDPVETREGASARRLVQVPSRGFATYRIRSRWDDELPAGVVEVEDLVATDPEAEAALWQYVCDLDLTTTIVARLRPPDEALPHLLQDPLRTVSSLSMPLYTRVLDVPRVLGSRSYGASGGLVLRVHDGAGYGAGTFALEVDTDGASCRPTDEDPALELSIESLSAVWLGGTRTRTLVDARRAVEPVPGAAATFDRLLAVERAPWTSFMF